MKKKKIESLSVTSFKRNFLRGFLLSEEIVAVTNCGIMDIVEDLLDEIAVVIEYNEELDNILKKLPFITVMSEKDIEDVIEDEEWCFINPIGYILSYERVKLTSGYEDAVNKECERVTSKTFANYYSKTQIEVYTKDLILSIK